MRTLLRIVRRASFAQVAALLVLAATLGGPGCGCGDDEGLSSCACAETILFTTPPPALLPTNVTLVNLVRDPVSGSIGFGPTISTFPSVFMAASNRGTIVRIDVNTGVILGEYRTSPQTHPALSPSRTTVDKFGECWVGNRTDINDTDVAHPGSVTRIGIVTGGTRFARSGPVGGPYTYAASATGEFLQGPFSYVSPSVVDRDGDGYIRTSYGLPNTSILNWDAGLSGANDDGGVSLADDECIVNFTRIVGSGTRGLAIDCDNNLWVGGLSSTNWQLVSGTTGVAGITRNIGSAYGGAIDANGVLWSVASPFWQHNIAANTTSSSPNPGIYGIAIDPCTTNVWTSGNALRHWGIPPSAVILGTFPWPNNFGHGLCIDLNGDIWAAMGSNGVFHYNSAGTFIPPAVTTGILYAKGTAVDQNGRIWIADLFGDQAVRFDPILNTTLAVPMGAGAGPYNYSDMTGLAALSSCGETGFVIATHDAICPGSQWGRISWTSTGTNLNGCVVTGEVRASDDPLNFPTTWTPVASGNSFCGTPTVTGRYIQARVTIKRPPGCGGCDPRLTSLQIECCDGVGRPPNVTLGGPYAVPAAGAGMVVAPLVALPPVSVQVTGVVTDPDGGALTARWAVDGVDAGPAVIGAGGHTSLTRDFPNGISVVTLTASDGRNTTTAKTTVMVGDHLAPVVTCFDTAPVVNGQILIQAFQAAVPDLATGTTAVDDTTPTPALLKSQSPAAGSIVEQGVFPIVVTVTDQAGNAATCRTLLDVDAVVAIATLTKYQIYLLGNPILLSATYRVPGSQIQQTSVFIDGALFTTVPGVLVGSINIGPLAHGAHEVQIVATSLGGIVSRSEALPFEVK